MVVANDNRIHRTTVEASMRLNGIQAVIIPALWHQILHDTGWLTVVERMHAWLAEQDRQQQRSGSQLWFGS